MFSCFDRAALVEEEEDMEGRREEVSGSWRRGVLDDIVEAGLVGSPSNKPRAYYRGICSDRIALNKKPKCMFWSVWTFWTLESRSFMEA
jgi:hypothetical protein